MSSSSVELVEIFWAEYPSTPTLSLIKNGSVSILQIFSIEMDYFQWNFPQKTQNKVQKAHSFLLGLGMMLGVCAALRRGGLPGCHATLSGSFSCGLAHAPGRGVARDGHKTSWALQALVGKGYANKKVEPKTESSFSAFRNPWFSLKNKLS